MFAIIITILVLEIAVPENLSEQSLYEALDDLRPTLVAWVISFLLTGMFWVAHRDLFARVRVVNRDLVWLNLLFLLPVSLIPFAASVLGKYPDEPVALHLYGVVLIAATLMRFVLYRYVVKRPALLWPDVSTDRAGLASPSRRRRSPSTSWRSPLADVSTTLSTVLYFSVPGSVLHPRHRVARAPEHPIRSRRIHLTCNHEVASSILAPGSSSTSSSGWPVVATNSALIGPSTFACLVRTP